MVKAKPAPVVDAGPPDERAVGKQLAGARRAFEALVERGPGTTREWKRYKKDAPWVLKVNQGTRTLFYLRPEAGEFKVTVILGARAAAAALAGRVSESLHEAIRTAKKYPEGRPVSVLVKKAADAALVEELVAVKLHPE